MTCIYHYGIEGQKLGVRRFQNPDGSLTSEGRIRYRDDRRLRNESKTRDAVNGITRSMSSKDRKLLGLEPGEKYSEGNYGKWVVKRVLEKHGDTPVAFLDFINDGDDIAVAFGVRGENEYRGKGYANQTLKKGMDWFEKNKDRLNKDRLVWYVDPENKASIHLAEKNGFQLKEKPNSKMLEYYRNIEFENAEKAIQKNSSNKYDKFQKQPIDRAIIKARSGLNDTDTDKVINLANKKFDEAAKLEPQVTKDVISAVSKTGSNMYGLEYRLKQPSSLAGKIGADSKDDGVSFEEACNGIKDVIRYTSITDTNNFVNNYQSVKDTLESAGYTETKCKNYYEKYKNGEAMHKAVQCNYKTPDGYTFEIQFQTPSSQAAKELKIPIYEERRQVGISKERAAELEAQMRDLAENVQDPPGIDKIKSH